MDKMKLEKEELKKIKQKINKIKKINKMNKKKNSQKLDTSPGLTTTVSFLVFLSSVRSSSLSWTFVPHFCQSC